MQNLRVLVVGYGAREHALVWKIAQSPLVGRIFVAPGNAGTMQIATNVDIHDEDIAGLLAFALDNRIDLTVVGPNDPLALGIVDAFSAENLPIFGPTQAAAQLESSKAFSKAFMQRHNIPTPAYATFDNYITALTYLDTLPTERVVVKVSGLGARGQGVTVCDTQAEARAALHDYLITKTLGDQQVIIEERISGRELSMFALSDGTTVVPMLPVRDHKRIGDGDTGPNTGGMGAFAPLPDVDGELLDHINATILQPTIRGMAVEGTPYVGVLYAGLMITDNGVQVLEYNCRFGNPEAEVLMSLMDSDLVAAMLACVEGDLQASDVRMSAGAAVSIVIAAPNYPAKSQAGLPIRNVYHAAVNEDVQIFHHGTACQNGQLVTSQHGRTLAVTAKGDCLCQATENAYATAAQIDFVGGHYRRDIGQQALLAI